MNAAEVFAESLVDLASQNPAFAGIHTPQSAVGATKVGVTEQFLERAEEYHRNYLDLDYWRFLLGNAFKALGAMPDPKIVIDIGSGSGNSVIPLADRFPHAGIVATDISPQLLAIRQRKSDEAFQDWVRQARDRAYVEVRLDDR